MTISTQISSSGRSLLFLAPPNCSSSEHFGKVTRNPLRYQRLLDDMQRLRGRVYLADGAIQASDLTPDGRHVLPTDARSWHLLTVDETGRTLGCTRFLQHSNTVGFDDLAVRNVPLARSEQWSAPLLESIQNELQTARRSGFSYVEVGGWALDEEIRGSTEALRGVLATFAWSRLLGGALGISTATERNGSASILRRLGGRPLDWNGTPIPAYFDSNYNCHMEILRFDSRSPNSRYEELIGGLVCMLFDIPVILPERPMWQKMVPGYTPAVEYVRQEQTLQLI